MMRRISLLATLGMFLLLPLTAFAEGPGVYLGAGVGSASFKDDLEIDDIDEDDVGYKLFAGYQPAPYVALEGGYRDFGKAEAGEGAGRIKIKTNGWDVYGMVLAPLGIVDLFVKGGAIFWDSDADVGGIDLSDDGTSLAWGLGGTLNLGAFGVRLEYERFEIDRPDELWMVTLSGVVTFGR